MAKRPKYQRPKKDFKPGKLGLPPSDVPELGVIADRVRYVPSGEHKNYPSEAGAWTIGHKVDKAKCDRFVATEWEQIRRVLQDAIRRGCIDVEFRGTFPARAWAYINDTLHEARLSNEMSGAYHGFPLEYAEHFPEDPEGLLRNAPRVTIPVH